MTGPQPRSGYWRLFGASAISNLGDGMGTVAYPWLASALTRDPLLIALVVAAQRLPWLVLSLPAGVITDRVDRRRLIVRMDIVRGTVTAAIGLGVLWRQGALPDPGDVTAVVTTDAVLYPLLLAATLLMGSAEVLRDNSAQTLMPALVDADGLEKANGRMWAAEATANQFVGPPLGSLLLGVAFALPFLVDAVTFFVAAALIATIPGSFRAVADPEAGTAGRPAWHVEVRDGIRWLRANPVLWPMAIVLGLMNGADALGAATLVIFAQEVLDVGPFLFAVIGAGGAIGSIVGGWFVPALSRRFGGGAVLSGAVGGLGLCALAIASARSWPVVMVAFSLTAMFGIGWNVVTVSLRQSVIPDHLLGRVNSVYRFLAWGSIPIGAALGGLLVNVLDGPLGRTTALRWPWYVSVAIHVVLLIVVRRKLNTAALDALRATGK